MKIIECFFLFLLLVPASKLNAQELNWRVVNTKKRHLVSASIGADYGSYWSLSYGYVVNPDRQPLVFGTTFTLPFGQNIADDWKWKINVQKELWHSKHLSFVIKPGFITRQYKSTLATIYNIGGDLNFFFGYLNRWWGIAAIINYDRTFATHIHHEELKINYPNIRDGWYGSSGGNFKFGGRVNFFFGSWTSILELGKMYGQDFNDNPTLPFYSEISFQKAIFK